ncbi:MAG: 50S ribosomal protein L28 [Patescibacteria group bacterium]|nr:50S ribosomal protein L28 [Patescibacteria group bacterium]
MSRVCNVTGKKRSFGHNVSHSKRRTKRSWFPNLVKHTLVDEKGRKKQIKVSARGLKTLYKTRRKKAKSTTN